MSVHHTLARWMLGCLLALAGALVHGTALAQSIESVLRPGDLVQSHAKWEDDCGKCHVRFDRAAQDRLCVDCHKDVGQDLRERAGFHGRLAPQTCRSCHTDHKGRSANIVVLDKARFNHTQTDYPLHGAHTKVECAQCHAPEKKYRDAPSTCHACHAKADVHKGTLGPRCADCHQENSWTNVKFDHSKTRFPLTGEHVDTPCADCHKGGRYKDLARTCVSCHKADDDRKGHQGQFGARCESCHDAKAWKPSTFNHDTDTRYALRGKHRDARCGDCHTGPLYRTKLSSNCIDCHQKDDAGPRGHQGSLGRDCAACHVERGWKAPGRFDHSKTKFPLLGRHMQTECSACHQSPRYQDAPKDCIGCHRKDDRHEATLGERCESCHTERSWKNADTRFDHDATRFKLARAHSVPPLQCKSCHSSLKHFRSTPLDCFACHKKDDPHANQLGSRCESCHNDRTWRDTTFDHRQARFALVGRHLSVQCADCHKSARYRDAPSDCYSCHRRDDRHEGRFGQECQSCHNPRAWGLWDYDHAKQARFVLDGAHQRLDCARCHTQPAPAGRATAEVGRQCVDCHRRDDVHDGAFGRLCAQCHTTEKWKQVRQRLGGAAFNNVEWAVQVGYASRLVLLAHRNRETP